MNKKNYPSHEYIRTNNRKKAKKKKIRERKRMRRIWEPVTKQFS